MSVLTTSLPVTRPRLLWRVAGALALAHVALLLAGFSQEVSPMHGDSAPSVLALLQDADYNRVLSGGFVESLSFVVLLPALVFLARAVGQRTEQGRWAAQTGLAAGVGYVAVTLAAGMPAGAAALYAAQHGADAGTVAAIVDIRNFAFFVSVLLGGAQALSVGISALSDGRATRMTGMTRWLGYGGLVAGTLCIIGVAADLVNAATMAWTVWWVGVAVTLLRTPGEPEPIV